jgi:hypothetical protein
MGEKRQKWRLEALSVNNHERPTEHDKALHLGLED